MDAGWMNMWMYGGWMDDDAWNGIKEWMLGDDRWKVNILCLPR